MLTHKDDGPKRTTFQASADLWTEHLAPVLSSACAEEVRASLRTKIEAHGQQAASQWLAYLTSPEQTKTARDVGAYVLSRIRCDPIEPFLRRLQLENGREFHPEKISAAARDADKARERFDRLLGDLADMAAPLCGRPPAPSRQGGLDGALANQEAWRAWQPLGRSWDQEHGHLARQCAEDWLARAKAETRSSPGWAGYFFAVRDLAKGYAREVAETGLPVPPVTSDPSDWGD